MERFVNGVEKVLDWFCLFFLLGMIVIGTAQLTLRYVFSSPLSWPEELEVILQIWFVFFGAVVVLKEKRHIAMPLIVDLIKSRPIRLLIDSLGSMLIIVFLIVLIWGTMKIQPMQASYRTPALGLPRNYLSFPVLISSILMLVMILFALWGQIKRFVAIRGASRSDENRTVIED
jgi:TRAP-type C4-dicarboxylate transport system permease small subunit